MLTTVKGHAGGDWDSLSCSRTHQHQIIPLEDSLLFHYHYAKCIVGVYIHQRTSGSFLKVTLISVGVRCVIHDFELSKSAKFFLLSPLSTCPPPPKDKKWKMVSLNAFPLLFNCLIVLSWWWKNLQHNIWDMGYLRCWEFRFYCWVWALFSQVVQHRYKHNSIDPQVSINTLLIKHRTVRSSWSICLVLERQIPAEASFWKSRIAVQMAIMWSDNWGGDQCQLLSWVLSTG